MNKEECREFTPREPKTGKRLALYLNETDSSKVKRGITWQATVTDQMTGKRYRVRGASCGSSGCFCDAIATEVNQ